MEFLPIFLNKKDKDPLYYQLYKYLAREIHSGQLPCGEKLPGKRVAAAQLGVSVNTVDTAYQMLAAEGYISARERSSFKVARLEQAPLLPPAAPAIMAAGANEEDKPAGFYRYSFSSGDIDATLFPRKAWNRIMREILAQDDTLFLRGAGQGDLVLRRALAEYLQGYRGVQCREANIVIGAGLEVLVGMLGRLFSRRAVAVETPGYRKTARILENVGITVHHVPVDEEGVRLPELEASGAKVIYLTPSHQFPTGGVMPVGRRTELLQWAQQTGGYIVEDDYDSEFRFDGRPLPSLQGLDGGENVIYGSTFSRSLAPGLRIAYLVLPPRLQADWQAAYGDYACTVSRPEQHALAQFMREGHFSRGLNRMRNSYRRRRNLLLQALRNQLPAAGYELENTHTGLYFLLHLPGRDAGKIAEIARHRGIHIRALSEYDVKTAAGEKTVPTGNAYPSGSDLVLGYGGLREEDMEAAVAALCAVI